MEKKYDVSYNPQLGYLKTVFQHSFDFLTKIRSLTRQENVLVLSVETYQGASARVELSFLSDTAFRLRMIPDEADKVFDNAVFHFAARENFSVEENAWGYCVKTARLTLRLRRRPWEMEILLDEKPLTREEVRDTNVDNMCKYLPIGFDRDETGRVARVRETMALYADESFYGFGEKFTGFNKRGQLIHCHQSDALSTNTEQSYKNIPYFMSSRGYAVLLNTFTENTFDMGFSSGVSYGMQVEDAVLDYVMLCNRDYKGLLSDYTLLTGRSPMIPRWSFGLWMSKCSYQTQEEVESVARMCREKKVPVDVIHIDGWMNQSNSGAWEWDRARFPDPVGMIRALDHLHIRLSLWMWPYIPAGSPTYEYAKEKGYLVKNERGEIAEFCATATSDRRVAAFDFTNPALVEWYRDRVQNVVRDGVAVIKTDFSEAVPMDARYFDGSNGLQGHNKLPLLYAKTIYEACRDVKLPAGERPMLWGRSGYAGSQNYPANWAGDSSTQENNLACVLQGGLSAGLSAVSFWGHDIGGFYNTDSDGYECPPTDTQYIRSAQFGLLSPLARCHGKTPREPWNFSEQVQRIFAQSAALRYRLAPYLYSAAYETHLTGVPMLRALLLEYPDDPTVLEIGLEYMLGASLLVAPVFDQDDQRVYLPQGRWAELLTGRFLEGERWTRPQKTLERIPVYLRENSVVPIQSTDVQYIADENFSSLTALVNLSSHFDAVLYDDDAQYRFSASLAGDAVLIETDLPMTAAYFYVERPVGRVTVNGTRWETKMCGGTVVYARGEDVKQDEQPDCQ